MNLNSPLSGTRLDVTKEPIVKKVVIYPFHMIQLLMCMFANVNYDVPQVNKSWRVAFRQPKIVASLKIRSFE